jgi:protein-disulfide isomerase
MQHQYEKSNDPVARWRQAPIVTFTNDLSGGPFGDYYQGVLSAPIQIVEFADYECPACRHMYHVLHDVLEKYQGSYLFIFKNYPLDRSCNKEMQRDLHQYACTAALFSRCAGEQGKFWESMDLLFSKDPEKRELSLLSLTERASQELSLDEEGIVECMESQRYAPKIKRDIADGVAADLKGTPSLWVNGRFVEEPSARNLEKIFQAVLEKAEK